MTHMQKFQFWSKRLRRGLIALISANLLLITGAIVLEACQSQEDNFEVSEVDIALNTLESRVRDATPEIRRLGEKYPYLFEVKNLDTTLKNTILEEETRRTLTPLVQGTRDLLRLYNVDERYLKAEFGNPDDPRIVLVGLMMLVAERKEKREVALNFARAFGTLGYAQDETTLSEANKDWVDCIIIAVGIDAAVEFLKGNVTETIAKKAIRKIATRTLGWVGAAIAVYEFGSCMGWY